MKTKIAELRKQRATAFDAFKVVAGKTTLTAEEQIEYDTKKRAVTDLDGQINRADTERKMQATTAVPVEGQERVPANAESDPYVNDGAAIARGLKTKRGLVAIAAVKMFNAGGSNIIGARAAALEHFGENHPVTRAFTGRALQVSIGASGGFIVPPDYVNEIIELLRPRAVVRSSNPRTLPMPRGTMTLPGQASAATASYGSETAKIAASQQTLDQIVASYKKLTALVPVTNDMMRYADPAADAFVRDDLVKVIALREDLAFLLGDGTQDTPRGYTSFANGYALSLAGTAGIWSSTANSTAAVGGNFITSNETFTLATVANELGGLVNKLDTANVPDINRVWFMHPRAYNYLFNVQNSLGVYVYRDELMTGKLLTYPVKRTTQIPINIHDATSAQTDCSFVMLAEMEETMILDSMTLELAVSREGSYVDSGGNTVSAFQYDQTLIRAIAEHDFQMRHDASVAINQFVRWAPAIT